MPASWPRASPPPAPTSTMRAPPASSWSVRARRAAPTGSTTSSTTPLTPSASAERGDGAPACGAGRLRPGEGGMIRVEDLHMHFGGIRAVDGVSIEIPDGSITGLIGPNGAGKSTLFNVIAGLFPPTSGRVWLDGEEITGLPPH